MQKKTFTPEEVDAINKYQSNDMVHSLTCCGYDGCTRENNDGVLHATEDGLICPCGKYIQVHCNEAIKNGELLDTIDNPLLQTLNNPKKT